MRVPIILLSGPRQCAAARLIIAIGLEIEVKTVASPLSFARRRNKTPPIIVLGWYIFHFKWCTPHTHSARQQPNFTRAIERGADRVAASQSAADLLRKWSVLSQIAKLSNPIPLLFTIYTRREVEMKSASGFHRLQRFYSVLSHNMWNGTD